MPDQLAGAALETDDAFPPGSDPALVGFDLPLVFDDDADADAETSGLPEPPARSAACLGLR